MSSLDSLIGNPYICVGCILMLWIVVLLNMKHLFRYSPKSGTGYIILWLTFTIYSVLYCPPAGDNISSMSVYYSYFGGIHWERLHFERFHFDLMDLVPYGYIYWRFVLWGIMGATTFVLLCRQLKLDKHLATIACCTFALPILLYYQRAAAGYSLLYLSIVFFIEWFQNRNSKMIIMSIICLITAIPFHDSMIFYIIIAYISVLLPVNKKSIIIICAIGILLKFSLMDYISLFLRNTSEGTTETAMYYIEENRVLSGYNFKGLIGTAISNGPLYVMIAYCLLKYIKNPDYFNIYEKSFLVNVLLLFMFSYLMSDTSTAITNKFYVAASLPLTLFFSIYFEKNRKSIACRRFVFFYLFGKVLYNSLLIYKGQFW